MEDPGEIIYMIINFEIDSIITDYQSISRPIDLWQPHSLYNPLRNARMIGNGVFLVLSKGCLVIMFFLSRVDFGKRVLRWNLHPPSNCFMTYNSNPAWPVDGQILASGWIQNTREIQTV